MKDAMKGRSVRPAVLILLLCCVVAGCIVACKTPDGTSPDARAELLPLPDLDLSAADAGARQQLDEQRATVEQLADNLDGNAADLSATAEAYGDLGRLYLTYDFLDAAEACLRNALRLQDDDYRWHYLLAYLLTTRGQPQASIPAYRTALELRPAFLPAILRLGRVYLALGQPADAKPWFEQALEIEPQIAAAHEGLARVAAANGDLATAVASFERALELEPAATGNHYALAQVYRDLGDLDQARHHLEQSGDVASRIVDPLINPLASMALSVQFYLVQGAEALDDDDFAAAVGAYRSALQLDTNNLPAAQGLAAGLERLGDLDGARQALERASRLPVSADDPAQRAEAATIHRSLGRLASLDGRDGDAIASYQASLALEPAQPGVLLRVANALARQRRFADAIVHYDRLVQLAPQWAPAVWERRGMAHVNLGQRDAAIADLQRAVDAAPDNLRLRQRFAEALEHLGAASAAAEQRQVAQGLVAAGADRGPLLLAEAQRLLQQQDFEAAEGRLRDILGDDPEAHEARRLLADLLGHSRRYDDAVTEYERVVTALPQHEAARRGQVVALILGGRLGEARLALQDALRTFPRHRGFALTQIHLLALSPDPTVRDGSLALQIAQRVHQAGVDGPSRHALALALAAAGRYPEAADLQRQLIDDGGAAGGGAAGTEGGDLERARLLAFEQGQAWTAQTADEILAPLGAVP